MPKVIVRHDGNTLSIVHLPPRLARRLTDVLAYERIVQLRGKAARMAGSNVSKERVRCYQWLEDDDQTLPRQLLAPAGYWPRIEELFKLWHVPHVYKRVWTHPKPEIFVPQWDRIRLPGENEFRYMQRETLEAIAANERGLVDCSPAWGKSTLFLAICQMWPKARIDITTYSTDVIRQITEFLKTNLPSVGMVGAGKSETGKRVTCYSIKSLHRSPGTADVLLVDECHESCTDDNMYRMSVYQKARMYGFSGSLGMRHDKADFELEGVFGRTIMQVSTQDAAAHGAVVPVRVEWLDVVMDDNPAEGFVDTDKERYGIWRNVVRNEILADRIREFPEDVQVLVVVKTIDHAMQLKKLLPHFTLCYNEQSLDPLRRDRYIREGCIDRDEPQMTSDRRIALKKRFERGSLKHVIVTPVWNRGVDFRSLPVLVRADAAGSAIADTQIPGRLQRLHDESGKRFGLLIDCLDQFDAGFRRKAMSRYKNYESKSWEQQLPEGRTRYAPRSGGRP